MIYVRQSGQLDKKKLGDWAPELSCGRRVARGDTGRSTHFASNESMSASERHILDVVCDTRYTLKKQGHFVLWIVASLLNGERVVEM
jgi:methyl coenzyme M reductase subunit C